MWRVKATTLRSNEAFVSYLHRLTSRPERYITLNSSYMGIFLFYSRMKGRNLEQAHWMKHLSPGLQRELIFWQSTPHQRNCLLLPAFCLHRIRNRVILTLQIFTEAWWKPCCFKSVISHTCLCGREMCCGSAVCLDALMNVHVNLQHFYVSALRVNLGVYS